MIDWFYLNKKNHMNTTIIIDITVEYKYQKIKCTDDKKRLKLKSKCYKLIA